MNPRLAKELRPLLLPWALATVAAVGHLAARPNSAYFHGEFGDFISGLAGFAFVLGVLVLAAMPMGSELHERTLGMLFSQPISRARLWKEKLFAATVMISLLAIAHGLTTLVMGKLTFFHGLLWVAFVVAAICSVGYHTLATRSVLVGIASAAGMPYAITLSAYLIVRYLLGVQLELSDQAALTLILIASGAYSICSLWLSRSQCINLELKNAVDSRAAEVPAALVPMALSNLFRCRPTGVTRNLIRKEVCLHKPIFLVSAIFAAAWLLTLLSLLLRPAWQGTCVATFHGLTGAQAVLMVILGGCVAFGDDKALGTSTWHLTLPVSARKQWFIKLVAALGTTLTLAVILPSLLAALTLFKAKVGFLAARSDNLTIIALLGLAVFTISFWSASMTTNTVRAALTTVLALFVFGFTIVASIWAFGPFDPMSGRVGSPDRFPDVVLLVAIGGILILALYQSFRQFCRFNSASKTLLWNMAMLAAVIFTVVSWRVHLHSLEGTIELPQFKQSNPK